MSSDTSPERNNTKQMVLSVQTETAASIRETSYFSLDEIAALTANVWQKPEHINSLNISDLSHHAVQNDVRPRPTNASTVTDMEPVLYHKILALNMQISFQCSVMDVMKYVHKTYIQ